MNRFIVCLIVLLIPALAFAGFNDRFASVELEDITATATELNQYALTVDITDASAAASVWVVAPHAGSIAQVYTVINGTVSDPAAISLEIAGVFVASGAIASGSTAGTVDTITPTANNVVTAGQAIEVITDGGSTGVARTTVTLLITR